MSETVSLMSAFYPENKDIATIITGDPRFKQPFGNPYGLQYAMLLHDILQFGCIYDSSIRDCSSLPMNMIVPYMLVRIQALKRPDFLPSLHSYWIQRCKEITRNPYSLGKPVMARMSYQRRAGQHDVLIVTVGPFLDHHSALQVRINALALCEIQSPPRANSRL